jgi:hypothetical protein
MNPAHGLKVDIRTLFKNVFNYNLSYWRIDHKGLRPAQLPETANAKLALQ